MPLEEKMENFWRAKNSVRVPPPPLREVFGAGADSGMNSAIRAKHINRLSNDDV